MSSGNNRDPDMRVKSALTALALLCLTSILYTSRTYTYAGGLDNVPPLTVSAVTDPRASGKTYKVKGLVTSVFKTKQGIIIIKLHVKAEDIHIESPVFPSLGRLVVEPKAGDTVEIIGNLGQYKGRPQIRPLAAEHVVVLKAPGKADAVSLSDAIDKVHQTLLVGPVSVISAKPFQSKNGKRHLRLTVSQDRTITNGIMFDGVWSEADLRNLTGGKAVILSAKVGRYKGQPSLVVNRVIPQ